KPCGRPAAGLDSGCGPASDISGGNGPEGKTHKTTRSAIRENRVSTKPGAVHAAQDTTAPRGPAGPATRRYLLAGLLACGRCGRRLESAWSNGKPAYRCRHGYTSATIPDSGRLKNTYTREDQILPPLAPIAILLATPAGTP